MKTGIKNNVMTEDNSPQSTPNCPPMARAMATGTVRVSLPVNKSANRNSFHVRIRAKTDVAANPAFNWGIQILKKTWVQMYLLETLKLKDSTEYTVLKEMENGIHKKSNLVLLRRKS